MRAVRAEAGCSNSLASFAAVRYGESEDLKTIERVVKIPVNPEATSHTLQEWVCPECDYFEEEAEEERS